MGPARAFELLTKLAVVVIAPAGAFTLLWLGVLLGSDSRAGRPPFGLVSCPVGLVLALAALPLIVSRWRGRVRRSPAWRSPEWWRFGTATPLLLAAAGLDYVGLRFLMSLGQ